MSRTLQKKPYNSLYITWDKGLILVTKSPYNVFKYAVKLNEKIIVF